MVGGADALAVEDAVVGRASDGIFHALDAKVLGRFDIRKSLRQNSAFAFDFAVANSLVRDADDTRQTAGFYVMFAIHGVTNEIIHTIPPK